MEWSENEADLTFVHATLEVVVGFLATLGGLESSGLHALHVRLHGLFALPQVVQRKAAFVGGYKDLSGLHVRLGHSLSPSHTQSSFNLKASTELTLKPVMNYLHR